MTVPIQAEAPREVRLASLRLSEFSRLAVPIQAEAPRDYFTAATIVHVGMNIPDKRAVFGDVGEQLEPGAMFAIYDRMVTGEGRPDYPVPWAATPATSALETVDEYTTHRAGAGFIVPTEMIARKS